MVTLFNCFVLLLAYQLVTWSMLFGSSRPRGQSYLMHQELLHLKVPFLEFHQKEVPKYYCYFQLFDGLGIKIPCVRFPSPRRLLGTNSLKLLLMERINGVRPLSIDYLSNIALIRRYIFITFILFFIFFNEVDRLVRVQR